MGIRFGGVSFVFNRVPNGLTGIEHDVPPALPDNLDLMNLAGQLLNLKPNVSDESQPVEDCVPKVQEV